MSTARIKLSTSQILALGFLVIILSGAIMLSLPVSNRSGESIPFINALFTSTSVTCLTGLMLYDTWSQFSLFGQMVMLVLIQVGGLGFMTFAIMIFMVLGRRIGLRKRSILMESVSAIKLGGIVRLVKHIVLGTLFVEGCGALLLFIRFSQMFGIKRGLWFSIFHSISAFCNAGVDLMGIFKPYGSLANFSGDALISFTIGILIFLGALGFGVWEDVITYKADIKKYSLGTKVVIAFTLGAIAVPSVLFSIMEKEASFQGMNMHERMINAIFSSISFRTAGFSMIDLHNMSEGGIMLTTLLMFIGAGPGSTGGGIKITTFAVLVLSIYTHIKREEDINIFGRRLEYGIIRRAWSSTGLYIMTVLTGAFILVTTQPFTIKEALFEAFSAMGTAGLTLGITRSLNTFSKIVIVVLMYAGRIGSLTVFAAVVYKRNSRPLKNPVEKIMIG